MKKFLLIIFFFSMSVFLMAQNADFFELPFSYNAYMYPDYRWDINPAISTQLERSINTYYGYFDFDRDSSKNERTVAGPGLIGGYDSSSTVSLDPTGQIGSFTRKAGTVNRIGAYVSPYFSFANTRTVDYNTSGEDIKTSSMNFSGFVSGNYLSAWEKNGIAMGYFGGLSLDWDPKKEEYTWTTDKAVNGGDRYISGGGIRTATINPLPYFQFGITKEDGGSWYSLSGMAYATFDDSSRQLTAVDTDADGYDDKIVTVKEQMTSTAAWGASQAYYDYLDQTQTYTVSVYPAMVKPLKNGKDLILSGQLDLLDLERVVSYTHNVDTDQSKNEVLTGSYGTSGSVFAGIREKTGFGAELRYGAYSNFDVNFRKENDVDAAGGNTFDPANTKHYTEVNWGFDPDNDDITNFGLTPITINADLGVMSGLQWRISPTVVFFGTGSFGVNFNYKEYALFDTATGKVWTEWYMRNTLSYNIGGDFGLQFQLPEGPFITISGLLPDLLNGTTTDNYIGFDPLPSGSNNITSDKNLSDGEGFTVTVRVTVRR